MTKFPYLFAKVNFIVKPLNCFTPIVCPFAKNTLIARTTLPFTNLDSHEPILLAHCNYKAFHRSFTHFCEKSAFNKFTVSLSSNVHLMMLDAQNEHNNISFVKSELTCPSTPFPKNSKSRQLSVLATHYSLQFPEHSPLPKLVTVLGHLNIVNLVLNDFDVMLLGVLVVEDLNMIVDWCQ